MRYRLFSNDYKYWRNSKGNSLLMNYYDSLELEEKNKSLEQCNLKNYNDKGESILDYACRKKDYPYIQRIINQEPSLLSNKVMNLYKEDRVLASIFNAHKYPLILFLEQEDIFYEKDEIYYFLEKNNYFSFFNIKQFVHSLSNKKSLRRLLYKGIKEHKGKKVIDWTYFYFFLLLKDKLDINHLVIVFEKTFVKHYLDERMFFNNFDAMEHCFKQFKPTRLYLMLKESRLQELRCFNNYYVECFDNIALDILTIPSFEYFNALAQKIKRDNVYFNISFKLEKQYQFLQGYKINKLRLRIPENSNELIEWSCYFNNCLASYVRRVARNGVCVFALFDKDELVGVCAVQKGQLTDFVLSGKYKAHPQFYQQFKNKFLILMNERGLSSKQQYVSKEKLLHKVMIVGALVFYLLCWIF